MEGFFVIFNTHKYIVIEKRGTNPVNSYLDVKDEVNFQSIILFLFFSVFTAKSPKRYPYWYHL